MKLSTLLTGLNGSTLAWVDGHTQEVPELGCTVNIVPFLKEMGWTVNEQYKTCTANTETVYEYTKYSIRTILTNQLDMGPLHRLFYIAALTPNYEATYSPDFADKEKLLEMAQLSAFQYDPFFAYLINKYNQLYPKRGSRILKKELPNNFQFYETNSDVVRLLAARGMFQQYFTTDTKCNLGILYNLIYKDQTYFIKVITGENLEQPNEAPCEILQYSTKVERYIKTTLDPKKVFFGIELELEGHTQSRMVKAHKLLKKHCIFKRDGSINDGMEIVSKPATIQEHKEAFKPFFDANLGYVAKSNCGIHIHASRGSMSFLQLGRIYAFLNNNKGTVIKIAGRESPFAKFDTNGNVLSPWYKVSGDKYVKTKRFSWDKYTAVNMSPEHTMEFRIFKSTTKWDEFCRFLEFPDALISYCSLAGNDNGGKIRTLKDMLTFSNFAAFVSARGKAYPQLNKFIQAECN